MSTVRRKLFDITTPAMTSRGSFVTIGEVIDAFEESNACTVRYMTRDGMQTTRPNTEVKINTPGILGWFPLKGDHVIIETIDNMAMIVGPKNLYYAKDYRSKYQLKKEILDSNPGGTIAGQIY